MRLKELLSEAEYTHIGYGKYKEKGKEKDSNAPLFKKDDNGKFVPISAHAAAAQDADAKKDTPKVNIFDKPKSDGMETVKSIAAKTGLRAQALAGWADENGVNLSKVSDAINSKKLKPMDLMTAISGNPGNKYAKDIIAKYSQSNDTKSDTPKVDPVKLTKLMPKADKNTFNNNSDINKIPDAKKKEISMQIDKLAELTKQAKEKGEAAPNFNLCQVTVPGTNLYCSGNAGIPREEMPQFKGKPTPGSPASKMKTDASGEVDTEPLFKKMLADKGIKTAETEIPSDSLKATQSELVGSKVAGMAKALEKDPNHPGITAPIYVSRDGYVVDGHHRWAAVTSAAIADGKPANMKVIVIDAPIKEIIPMANKFAEEIGVAAKKADANQEGPKSNLSPKKVKDDLEDIKGTKSEKLMNSLLKGDKDPQTSLGLGDSQYDSLLKKLAKIGGESEHEEKFRNNNYSTAELEKWAKERVELVSNQSKETPSKEEPKSEPKKLRQGNPQVNKATKKKAEKLGITPQKLGKEEYQKKMAQAAYEALTDANFHSEARELIAKLEGKPELAEKPDYPDVRDPKFKEKMDAIRAKYASEYSDDVEDDARDLGIAASQESGWSGDDAVDGIAFTLRMNGFHKLADTIQSVIKENKSTRLSRLLPESLINEGTRSQVGVIKGGKIVSVYVHYDGYPSNMKPGLQKHMKDEKDVMTLIKKGGARGIYDDKDIEYYGNMKPMKGDVKNIDDYVRNAGNEASADYVYLYNTADKKWYYAKTYDDTKLKKL